MRSAASTIKQPKRLATIQAGRGLAALAVALFHANAVVLPLQLYHGAHVTRVFDIGDAGVEFFFVLSGFIIFTVHRDDFGRPERARQFLWKRFVRIFPIYWLVMAFVLAVHPVAHDVGDPRSVGWLLSSLALVPTDGFPVLGVAWTLQHEVLFYAVFILFLLSPRVGRMLFVGWGLACIAGMLPVLHGYVHPFPWHFFLSPFNLLFSFGMLSAIAAERIEPDWVRFLLWAGIAIFLFVPLTAVYNVIDWNNGLRTLCEGVGAAMAVVGMAAGERQRGWLVPLALAFLGDASYSIYLVHLPAMRLAAPLVSATGLPALVPAAAVIIVCGAIALAAGVATHLFAERPLLRLGSRHSRGRAIGPSPGRSGGRFHDTERAWRQ